MKSYHIFAIACPAMIRATLVSAWGVIAGALVLFTHAQEKPVESVIAAQPSAYVLSPNDRIQVRVFQEDDLTNDYRISPEGTINFPLIGSTRVGGMSPGEASRVVSEALRRYLKHPQVNISVLEFTERRFTVMGQVQRPGTYVLPPGEQLDLLSAIAAAGGFTRVADQSNVSVKRRNSEEGVSSIVNAKELARPGVPGFTVQPGDQIVVGERLF